MIVAAEPLLDSRELAIIAWLVVPAALVLILNGRARRHVPALLRGVVSPPLGPVFGLMAVYVTVVVVALGAVSLWTTDLLSETVFWFFGTAIVLFFRTDGAVDDARFFRRKLTTLLTTAVVVEFVVNLYPLGIVAEMFLVPSLFILGGLLAVAATKPEFRSLHSFFTFTITAAGVVFLARGLLEMLRRPEQFGTLANLREFVLPIALTLSFIPFIYAWALALGYSKARSQLRWPLRDDPSLLRFARRRLLRVCGFRLTTVRRAVTTPWAELLYPSPPTRRDIEHVLRHIKSRNTHTLATSTQLEARLSELDHARPPGWEYLYFAARLQEGEDLLDNRHTAWEHGFGRRRSFDSTTHPKGVAALLREESEAAESIVEQLNEIFSPESVNRAFGLPGEPGDAALLRSTAEALILMYDDMLTWAESLANMPVDTSAREVVEAYAHLLDRPMTQIRAYIARWTKEAERLPQRLRDALQHDKPVRLNMTLKLTIDPKNLKRIKTAVAHFGK